MYLVTAMLLIVWLVEDFTTEEAEGEDDNDRA